MFPVHAVFPHALVNFDSVVWRRYLHGFQSILDRPDPGGDSADFHNGGYGAYVCTQILKAYLLTGELPEDGTVCPIDGPAASALALDIAVAHAGRGEGQTCLMPAEGD